jgi:hypothetical protein
MKDEIKNKMDENMKEMENKMEEKMNENWEHMEKKMNENSAHMENNMDRNMGDMKNKMDENKEEIQKSMKELQNSMSSMIFHALDERLCKGDLKIQGNHENKENKVVENQSHMGSILSHLESTNIESQSQDHSLLQGPHHEGFMLTPRSHFIPKIDMRKFDGKDPITQIFHMERLFDIYQTTRLKKLPIASLYLENYQFVSYQWLCEIKKNYLISWSIFMDELISHYGDIKRNTFFIQLINIRKKGPIIEHIQQFQKISLRVKNIIQDNFLKLYLYGNFKGEHST